MRRIAGTIVYSPSDLISFVKSPFASWMDRKYLEDPAALQPDEEDPMLSVLAKRGDEHERAYLQEMVRQGLDVCAVTAKSDAGFEETRQAIAAGRAVIFQANLRGGGFAGYADFLHRVDLLGGGFNYAVWDTKLSRHPKPYFIIQLCCYAQMYEEMTGKLPDSIGVVLGTGKRVSYRVKDFYFYYRRVRKAFLHNMAEWSPERPPVPDTSGDHGRWGSYAEAHLREIDHPSQVANITRGQIVKLARQGVTTMAQLAGSCPAHVPGIAADVLSRLKRQAQLQIESADRSQPDFDVLAPPIENPHLGLAALPPASELDVFFDMEGYPAKNDWLEYLFGADYLEADEPRFRDWWAHDEVQEKAAFEAFLDWVYARWQADPGMHIYHYAAYETTAIKRLMGKYGTREDKVDALLRGGVFVDLYAVVRHSLLVGEPSYSIKNLEHLYMERRGGDVTTAASSVVYYDAWCDAAEPEDWRESPLLKSIRDYNVDDCVSTRLLADWLRERQQERGIAHLPGGDAIEPATAIEVSEKVQVRLDLADALLARLPSQRSADPVAAENERITELLAWLLDFHRRCDKPMWWRKFERQEMSLQELWDDMDCLAGLQLKGPPRADKRSFEFDYRFDPDQDTKLRLESRVSFSPDLGCTATIVAFDPNGALTLRTSGKQLADNDLMSLPDDTSVIPYEFLSADVITESIFRVVSDYSKDVALPSCLEDFLRRAHPRLDPPAAGALVQPGEDVIEGGIRVARSMQDTCLCIQGPPGTGKTFTAARTIKALLEDGKRVGISSNSHKAILNLMQEVCAAGYAGPGMKVGGEEDEKIFAIHRNISYEKSSGEAVCGYQKGLIGGTAWLFSREDIAGKLDYLFVDEAGQVSLANLVGMSASTRNIVLMGDQMQLGQPIQGSHPGESGQSILEYYLQGHATIPDDLGIFLATTWRMHPDVCSFISEAVYEGRLRPEPGNVNRVIECPAGGDRSSASQIPAEAGIVFVPVEHEGNTQGSDEEVAQIAQLVAELTGRTRYDRHGKPAGPITVAEGMIFVSPYNLQVRKLKRALPEGARIASVDKFQGQQAPIVAVSMCCSPGEYGTRGLKFVLDPNRLNVAISRAQSLAIVVGDQRIAESQAVDIEDMRRLNLFCWLREITKSG